mgnify:CR=1 FL=1
MEIGTLVKTKTNHMTARVNLPYGYGIVTKVFREMERSRQKIVYVQWVGQSKPRPVNTVYLEVICK